MAAYTSSVLRILHRGKNRIVDRYDGVYSEFSIFDDASCLFCGQSILDSLFVAVESALEDEMTFCLHRACALKLARDLMNESIPSEAEEFTDLRIEITNNGRYIAEIIDGGEDIHALIDRLDKQQEEKS